MNRICLFFFLLNSFVALAQPDTDELLAKQFFDNREFDKSAILFEKLYNKTNAQIYFDGYLESLLALNNFTEAEKFIKKQIKKSPNNLTLKVHLGYIYRLSGQDEKSKKEYNEAINKMTRNPELIIQLSQAFNRYKESDYAIATLTEGKKLMREEYTFNMELAQAYADKNDYKNMFKEYLELIKFNEFYISQVQNLLQGYFSDDFKSPRAEEFRMQLLKNIQQYPDNYAYTEMLIWFFIQQKDFDSAFLQAKAAEKRSKELVGRVLQLAQICLSNFDYDAAIKCFEYEVQKGTSNPYYSYARTEFVNTIQKKVTESNSFNPKDISDLESTYLTALKDMGYNAESIGLVRGLAHLKAFYKGEPEQAIELLQVALTYKNASAEMLAECKLELGDIYIFIGEMWEPALLYGQVDKSFKYDAIGQEAKFRNARLSFYKGEFEWAQAQLDVLKGATSKLIANDALELSLLISDNTVDSNFVPLTMFSRADLMSFQNYDSLALLTLDSINKEFPGHSLSDDILYKKYKIAYKQGNFRLAADKLEQLILNYGEDLLGDDAVFKLAELYEKKLNDSEKAKKLYQDVLLNYPASLYTVEARKRYRKMRGDGIN
ncbi:MAG: tetratricopeptide repeat protein [Bacteroidota bacterium]